MSHIIKQRNSFRSKISDSKNIIRYCPKNNYIIQLNVNPYLGSEKGTLLPMAISTNSKHSRIFADSGQLADVNGEHVNLIYF